MIVIQCLRICNFASLPYFYFGLRNDKKEYDNADAERQSLLRKKVAPKPSGSEDSTATENGCGSTNAQESDTAEETASDAESEDSWLAEQRKGQELIAQRLKQDGNWFTYAKGFTASSRSHIRGQNVLTICRYSFLTSGQFIVRPYNLELFLLDFAFLPPTP